MQARKSHSAVSSGNRIRKETLPQVLSFSPRLTCGSCVSRAHRELTGVDPCRDCFGHLTPLAVHCPSSLVPGTLSPCSKVGLQFAGGVSDQGTQMIPAVLCCPCWNVCSWALLVLSSIPPLHRGCCRCSVCPGRDMKTHFKLRA